MTTGNTSLLELALPVEGELDGQWGDVVNYAITSYVDIAVAGTLTLNGDGAVTLLRTTGDDLGTNIDATTAQYAIIKITGTLTTTKIITAPSFSKTYIVDNAANGGAVTFKASGQAGVSVAVGEKCRLRQGGFKRCRWRVYFLRGHNGPHTQHRHIRRGYFGWHAGSCQRRHRSNNFHRYWRGGPVKQPYAGHSCTGNTRICHPDKCNWPALVYRGHRASSYR
jgi:hypothetical protein